MSSQNTCQDCGALIRWAKRPNGRTHPPLELASAETRYVIDEQGHVRQKVTYVLHVCEEGERSAYAKTKREQAEARAQTDAFLAKRNEHDVAAEVEKFQRAVYELAMVYVCPKCSAAVGEPCENLTKRRSGQVIYTATPHLERKLLIPTELHPFWSQEGYVVTPHTKETP